MFTRLATDGRESLAATAVPIPVWPDWAIYYTLGNFSKPVATNILPKLSTFLGSLSKVVKIFHFSIENQFGRLLYTFGDILLGMCSILSNKIYPMSNMCTSGESYLVWLKQPSFDKDRNSTNEAQSIPEGSVALPSQTNQFKTLRIKYCGESQNVKANVCAHFCVNKFWKTFRSLQKVGKGQRQTFMKCKR